MDDFHASDLPKTKDRTYEFKGIPSGDCDSFCWDVSRKEFIKIKGEEPNKFDKSYVNEGLFRIYPNDFYGFDKPECSIKISIKVIKCPDNIRKDK